MSIYSPGLVLWDFEPEKNESHKPEPDRRRDIADVRQRIGQYQVEIPRETANRFFKLRTERRPGT
jgi:hypothetical protein